MRQIVVIAVKVGWRRGFKLIDKGGWGSIDVKFGMKLGNLEGGRHRWRKHRLSRKGIGLLDTATPRTGIAWMVRPTRQEVAGETNI